MGMNVILSLYSYFVVIIFIRWRDNFMDVLRAESEEIINETILCHPRFLFRKAIVVRLF